MNTSFSDIKKEKISAKDLPDYLEALKDEMTLAAKNLEFEKAAEIRDMLIELEKSKTTPGIIDRE